MSEINRLSDRRAKELRTVQLQLIHFIQHARCWHDIKEAADAMFHARLIWEPLNHGCPSLETQNGCARGDVRALDGEEVERE